MKIKKIADITGGKMLSGDVRAEISPSRISTDTRSIKKGDLFIALKGLSFDGNDYVEEAFKRGAAGAIVSQRSTSGTQCNHAVIKVKDTTIALGAIAGFHRSKFDIPVVAVTGSNGKTTVKEIICSLLSSKGKVLKNEGTKNNEIGVPQTLLKLDKSYDICVVELGMNHPGEIARLSGMARPTIAVITNIGPSHLEFLRNLNGVLRAKLEILHGMSANGKIFVNGDDPYLQRIKGIPIKTIKFGLGKGNDVRAEDVKIGRRGARFSVRSKTYYTRLLGLHNVYNALSAIMVAESLGAGYERIAHSLSGYSGVAKRLNLRSIGGVKFIDDTYNSNPASMRCAVAVLKDYPDASKWVVSADMLELGKASAVMHEKIGQEIGLAGAVGLITLGNLSKHTIRGALSSGMDRRCVWHVDDHEKIVRLLKENLRKGDVVLVKGSRRMRMERVIELFAGRRQISE